MKLKLLVGLSGPTFSLSPGDEYECDEAEGLRLIKAEFAILASGQSIETATAKAPVEKRRKRKDSE